MRYVIDIETNGHLEDGLNYLVMPYRLKPEYKLWMLSIRNVDTFENTSLVLEQCTRENIAACTKDATMIIGHNILQFDLLVLKLLDLIDYEVGFPGQSSTFNGKDVELCDTLIWSKILNPDRFDQHGKHSLAAWGKRLGEYKQNFHDFSAYSETMKEYCEQDTLVNARLFHRLMFEKQRGEYDRAYSMESKLCDLTVKQQHFGFHLNQELAQESLHDLDQKMQEIRAVVDPLMPERKLTKTEIKHYTPPVRQFLKNGELSSYSHGFAERIGGTIIGKELDFEGKRYKFPIKEPIKTTGIATIDHIDLLKRYLMDLGWQPNEWKERDLIKKPDKTKKTKEELEDTVERYVNQTFDGYFSHERCQMLGVKHDAASLRAHLMKQIAKEKPVWVPTAPKIAVGLEKNVCPGLEALGEKADFVLKVIQYFTYRHRRNAILGGYANWEDEEELDDEEKQDKGFLPAVREDGRIPTPADTVAANTGRYRHKIVCNIPRVTSLYGERMRGLFEPGKNLWQLGFDFASLEARIQGHYCIPYTNGVELAAMMLAEKPNDIHTVTGNRIGIPRAEAKSVNYACLPMDTEVYTSKGWQMYDDLNTDSDLLVFDSESMQYRWQPMLEKRMFLDKEVIEIEAQHATILSTEDHRWLGYVDGTGLEYRMTADMTDDFNILSDLWKHVPLRGSNKRNLGVQPTFCVQTPAGTFVIRQANYTGITGNCIFGAQPAKLAKMLNCDQQRANDIFEAFWESVPALAELKTKLEQHWETLGKTHIKGLDGRLLCTRSKHSLVNVAFQSGGAITVKWSIVRILQKMQEAGILGNPFEHTADQIKVWQMIVNHDEGQYAVHPKLLNVKVFKTDEEAAEFVKANPGCSAIGHGSKGPYVALETLPVTCIKQGIETARKELKIRVDLGIEYIVGKSWAQCH